MTIASAFNSIAVAQGGTANTSGTISGAIDALNDALAGSDQHGAQTIEQAVLLLGEHIGGGGGGSSKLYYFGPDPTAATYEPGSVALAFEDGTMQGYPCKIATLPSGYTAVLTLAEAPETAEGYWMENGAPVQTQTSVQIYLDGDNPQVWATAPASDFFISLE